MSDERGALTGLRVIDLSRVLAGPFCTMMLADMGAEVTQIYLTDGRVPERIGNRYESCYPYDSFRAADGSVVIAAANDKLWKLVCRTIDRPEFADDARFDTNAKRVDRHAEIKPLIEAWTRRHAVDDVVECSPLACRRRRSTPSIASSSTRTSPVRARCSSTSNTRRPGRRN